jgi:hypothetical protein
MSAGNRLGEGYSRLQNRFPTTLKKNSAHGLCQPILALTPDEIGFRLKTLLKFTASYNVKTLVAALE